MEKILSFSLFFSLGHEDSKWMPGNIDILLIGGRAKSLAINLGKTTVLSFLEELESICTNSTKIKYSSCCYAAPGKKKNGIRQH